MKIIGVDAGGAVMFGLDLDHGADPAVLAHDRGFHLVRPLDAVRDVGGDLVLRMLVRPLVDEPRPVAIRRSRGRNLALTSDRPPVVRQRVAAYAVVVSERGLLATQFSARTTVAGRWGMPGGGLDDHEQPASAVLREVVEETSQAIVLGDLTRVHTSHWIGRNPHGTIEDFHAIRLIYRGRCPAPSDPVVLDAEGTTRAARWVPLEAWQDMRWTRTWRDVLFELLAPNSDFRDASSP
jgi:8-oxo-dGTP pyrophosphatase MutT (NUDIX family)